MHTVISLLAICSLTAIFEQGRTNCRLAINYINSYCYETVDVGRVLLRNQNCVHGYIVHTVILENFNIRHRAVQEVITTFKKFFLFKVPMKY